jgi:hypothetical protein
VQQTLDTLAHLFRGFVRERDREDVPTGNVFVGDEISNAMGDGRLVVKGVPSPRAGAFNHTVQAGQNGPQRGAKKHKLV